MKRWEKSQFRVGDEGDDTPSPFSSSFVLDPARKRGYELFLYYYYIIVLFYCIIVLLYYLYYYCIILLIRI